VIASSLETAEVVAVTVTDIDPAGTVIEPGNVKCVELSDKLTLTPPLGALPLRMIEQLTAPPDDTVVGLHTNDVSDGAAEVVRVSEADLETPP
jgi:hypothetical protein